MKLSDSQVARARLVAFAADNFNKPLRVAADVYEKYFGVMPVTIVVLATDSIPDVSASGLNYIIYRAGGSARIGYKGDVVTVSSDGSIAMED